MGYGLRHGVLDFKNDVVAPSYPTQNLLARYAMENDMTDSYLGTYNGSGSLAYTAGKVGQGGNFNGSSHYIDTGIPYTFFDGTDPWTICLWINSTTANKYIVGNWTTPNTLAFNLNFAGSRLKNEQYRASVESISSAGSYTDGNWHMVCFGFNGTGLTLNIDNGVENITSGAAGALLYGPGANLTLGRYGVPSSNYYPGKMDQVYIYSKALSSAEVSQLWNGGSGI